MSSGSFHAAPVSSGSFHAAPISGQRSAAPMSSDAAHRSASPGGRECRHDFLHVTPASLVTHGALSENTLRLAWSIWPIRSIWYPRRYRILHVGQILRVKIAAAERCRRRVNSAAVDKRVPSFSVRGEFARPPAEFDISRRIPRLSQDLTSRRTRCNPCHIGISVNRLPRRACQVNPRTHSARVEFS